MTSKEAVRLIYPKARAEKHRTNSREVYFLIRDGNAFTPMGYGATESKAWGDAKDKLPKQQ